MKKTLLILALIPSFSFATNYKISFKNNIIKQAFNTTPSYYTSCKEILNLGKSKGNGLYKIKISSSKSINLYCDMTKDGGGWTLVMRGLGGDITGWGTDGELNIANASLNSAPTGNTFKLSDVEINSIRGSNGIYRLKSDGLINQTRFVKAFNYNHLNISYINSTSPSATTYSDTNWDSPNSAIAPFSGTFGISDDAGHYQAFFTTNYYDGNNYYWRDGIGQYFSTHPSNNDFCYGGLNGCNFTMWIK